MRRFLGLAAPPEFAREVQAWQRSLSHVITAPHITLKAPGGLTDDLAWLPQVQQACARFSPLVVTLSGVRTFGKRVIYLGVRGERLPDLHRALLAAVSPARRLAHEGEGYTPHLTIVLTDAPLGVPFGEALELARRTFTAPVSFTADSVRLYRKPIPGTPYQPERDFPLGP